ncbi:MAG: hydrogenase [Sphingobacteriia bacterium 28-36-52]|nr:MAG: hydrogenase [Sphingobacteriia bacterium 28-36-52]
MISIVHSKQSKWLLCLGIILFMLGLIIGLFIPILKNSRMGLSAHLEGTLNGMFLLIIGIIWDRILLSTQQLKWTFYLVLYSSFANFLAVTIAAVSGAGKMMPIAGGKDAGNLVEWMISILLISLSLALITACILIFKGLLKYLHLNK